MLLIETVDEGMHPISITVKKDNARSARSGQLTTIRVYKGHDLLTRSDSTQILQSVTLNLEDAKALKDSL